MLEYRVEIYAVREAEREMNRMAADGWRVVGIMPNLAMGHGIVSFPSRFYIRSTFDLFSGLADCTILHFKQGHPLLQPGDPFFESQILIQLQQLFRSQEL